MNGIHHACQRDGQSGLRGIEPRGQQPHELRSEHDTEHRDGAQEYDGERADLVGETPRGHVSVGRKRLAEGRGEGGRQRPFGEQIAQQVGNAKGDDEGVHQRPATEQRRADLIACESEDAAAQDREAHEARGARIELF